MTLINNNEKPCQTVTNDTPLNKTLNGKQVFSGHKNVVSDSHAETETETSQNTPTSHVDHIEIVNTDHTETSEERQHPLHIVLVTETWFPDVNGVAMSLGQLMRELVQLGHKVSLIRPKAKTSCFSDKVNEINKVDTRKDPVNEAAINESAINEDSIQSQTTSPVISKEICVRGVPIPRYSDMQFGVPQYRLIKRELQKMRLDNTPVDIVHIATEGPLGLASLTAAKRLNIPVTTGYHTQFHDFSKHFGMGIIAKPMMGYFKWFHNWSDATCVPSQKTQDDLSQLGFKRIHQVGRGVDTKHFNPARRSDELRKSWGAKPQHTVLIMVSRLSPEKGVDLVINAFRALQTAQIHRAAKLVIVGEGPDYDRLQSLAAPCGDDVILTGAKLGVELAEHYASGDAFVFASQVETFGNVVTEAMASGLPVFAFDDAAAGMLVTEDTGGLVPIGQKDEFIKMVAELPKMQRLHVQGQQAREAVAQFSWIRPAKQMLEMFNVAIAKHNATYDANAKTTDQKEIKEGNSVLKPLQHRSWFSILSD